MLQKRRSVVLASAFRHHVIRTIDVVKEAARTIASADHSFDDRLLTEAVHAYELGGTQRVSIARETHPVRGDFEHELIVRAQSLQVAGVLQTALGRVRRGMTVGLLGVGVGGALVGGGLAVTLLAGGGGEPVNFYWLLLVVFGLQMLALLLWLVFALIPSFASSAGWLGRILFSASTWIVRRFRATRATIAAVQAWVAVLRSRQLGKWGLGVVSHFTWLIANGAFLIVAIILLSTRSYTFHWETTILSDAVFVQTTRAVAWLPERIGFAVPSHDQIVACGPGASREALADASTAWAGLLIGCVVVYGMAPRTLLLVISLIAWRLNRSRYRLDISRYEHGYADLRPTLHAGTRGLAEPADEGLDEDIAALRQQNDHQRPGARGVSDPVLIGLELPHEIDRSVERVTAWGFVRNVDGRADRNSVFNTLVESATEPKRVVIAVDAHSTADTGHASFIMAAAARVTRPVVIALTGGATLLKDTTDQRTLKTRIEQWRGVLRQAGVADSRILLIDLDCLTEYARHLLRTHVTDGDGAAIPPRYVWWRAACTCLKQACRQPQSNRDVIEEQLVKVFDTPAGELNGHAVIAAETRRGAARRIAHTADAVRHPLRAAVERVLHSVVRRGSDRRVGDAVPYLVDALTFAMMLDLQGRCDPSLMHDVTTRVIVVTDLRDMAAADLIETVRQRYEALSDAEGIA